MKKLTLGLLASCCTLAFSANALADPFPDGLFQAGYLKQWNIVTCPPVLDVIGTRIITDPGYDWSIRTRNFQNLMDSSTNIQFVAAGMDRGVAKCFYKVRPILSMESPTVVLVDKHHFLDLSQTLSTFHDFYYKHYYVNIMGVCGPIAKDCVFVPKH